jgi:hypothetical protein
MRELPQAFWDALDEVPRTPRTLMVQGRQGEMRHVPISTLAAEFRSRSRHPETERRARWLKLTGYLLEKEELLAKEERQ